MRMGMTLGIMTTAIAVSASAQSSVELSRAVYVERSTDGDGFRTIELANEFRRGETVILLVEWTANRNDTSVIVSSAIPDNLIFQQSSQRTQAVSVDGGRNWGWIGSLRINDDYGERLASVEDVTHLRWQIPAHQVARSSGRITYSAIVR